MGDSDECRKAFEEWENSDASAFLDSDALGPVDIARLVWQATWNTCTTQKLLAALVDLMKYQYRPEPGMNDEYDDVLDACEEAIAKAKGRESVIQCPHCHIFLDAAKEEA